MIVLRVWWLRGRFINTTYLIRIMEQGVKFRHKVSKGSRFNQIYVPLGSSKDFEVGDLVEVRLVEKKKGLCYSKSLSKLNDFKEKLVREVFSFLGRVGSVEQVFVVGSFLTSNDWDDIDLLIVGSVGEGEVIKRLGEKFGFKFHVIVVDKDRLDYLVKVCPLTRSMLYYHIADKEFDVGRERVVDVSHIEYLLMMPEDVLEINVDGKVFYDVIRRLISIERFLGSKEIDSLLIDKEVVKLLGRNDVDYLKENCVVEGELLKKVRGVIKSKLKIIRELLNGKKR